MVMRPLDQLIAFVSARGLDDRLAYWLHTMPDLDRAWARVPRPDWLLAVAVELGVHQGVINAAQTDADLVASVDARGTHLTVTELRCAAIRRHVKAEHVLELLRRLPAAEGRTGVRLRLVQGSAGGARRAGGSGA